MADDEALIREACSRGDAAAAVTVLLERYGPELLGYLSALQGDRRQARDAYCLLAEDLWRGLLAFEWRCTARAWAYTLARNALARQVNAERRQLAADQTIRQLPWFEQLLDRTHSSTPMHLRSEVRSQFRTIIDRLSEEEQTLLMLRIDRNLSWKELAIVLGQVGSHSSLEETSRAAARLRQRFITLKNKLRELVKAEGLLTPGGG